MTGEFPHGALRASCGPVVASWQTSEPPHEQQKPMEKILPSASAVFGQPNPY